MLYNLYIHKDNETLLFKSIDAETAFKVTECFIDCEYEILAV